MTLCVLAGFWRICQAMVSQIADRYGQHGEQNTKRKIGPEMKSLVMQLKIEMTSTVEWAVGFNYEMWKFRPNPGLRAVGYRRHSISCFTVLEAEKVISAQI